MSAAAARGFAAWRGTGAPWYKERHPMELRLVLIAALVLFSSRAQAQRRERPLFHISNWRGLVATDARYDRDVRDSSRGQETDIEEWLLGQEIRLGADGWLYHPALLDFSAEVGTRFQEDLIDSSGGRSSQVDGTQLNFNTSLNILPRKPYPISVSAGQAHSEISAPFAPLRTIDTLHYGAGMRLHELAVGAWKIPSRLAYRHVDTQTNGAFGYDQVRDDIDVALEHESNRTRSRLDYNWGSQESMAAAGRQDSVRQNVRFFDDRDLDRGTLSSNLLLWDSAGDFESRAASLAESLRLPHGRTVTSNYNYSLNYQDSETSRQVNNRGQIGLIHQLYGSLTSTVSVGGNYSDFTGGRTTGANGSLGFTYSRRIPWGRVALRFAPSYGYQDEELRPGLFTVLAEDHTVALGRPVVLERFNVVEDSIVVTDPVTRLEFVAGVDYTVVQAGAQTILEISPLGNIDPETTPVITVRYDYERQPSRTFTERTLASGLSLYLWDHINFDLSYSDTRADLLEGTDQDGTLADEQRFLTSLSTTLGRNRTRLEYERTRSNILPRERYTATHSVGFQPNRRTTMDIGAGYSHDVITDPRRVSDVYSAGVTSTTVLPLAVLGRLNLYFRYHDEAEQNAAAQGGVVSLIYQYRRIRFQLQERLSWTRVDTKIGEKQHIKELVNTVIFRVERPF